MGSAGLWKVVTTSPESERRLNYTNRIEANSRLTKMEGDWKLAATQIDFTSHSVTAFAENCVIAEKEKNESLMEEFGEFTTMSVQRKNGLTG